MKYKAVVIYNGFSAKELKENIRVLLVRPELVTDELLDKIGAKQMAVASLVLDVDPEYPRSKSDLDKIIEEM